LGFYRNATQTVRDFPRGEWPLPLRVHTANFTSKRGQFRTKSPKTRYTFEPGYRLEKGRQFRLKIWEENAELSAKFSYHAERVHYQPPPMESSRKEKDLGDRPIRFDHQGQQPITEAEAAS